MAAIVRFARSSLWSVSAFKRALPSLPYASDADKIPTDEEQATGLEKKELDALAAGIEDPFRMSVEKFDGGTKEKPHLVPSMFASRIVGCICDEETVSISWMMLHQGSPQRCDCGKWLELTRGSSINIEL